MSRSFFTSLNLNFNQLLNAVKQNLGTFPGSPVPGLTVYNTTFNASYTYNGTAWVSSDASKLVGTIPMSALTFDPSVRSNQTGTQVASTISNLAATVQSYSLSSFAAPTAAISMAGYAITNLASPTTAGQAAEYSWVLGQVQAAAAGIVSKPAVQVIATTNLALSGLQTIDGYTTLANDRVLVTGQTTASQNGVYNVSAGAWARTTVDGSAPGEIEPGATWFIIFGTVNASTQWRCSNTGTVTIGTTAVMIVQSGAGAIYTAANGVQLVGSQFSAQVVAGGGVLAASGGISVDPAVVPKMVVATIGDGSSTSIAVTHNLNTLNTHAMIWQVGTPNVLAECDVAATSVNVTTFTFAVAPANNSIKAVILGVSGL